MKTTMPDKITLKKFGTTMAGALLVISALVFLRHRNWPAPLLVTAFIFLLAGLILPNLLKPLYSAWMRLAFILAWVNTRIILVILFYLVLTPISLVLRILRVDLLEAGAKRETYWKKKEIKDFDPADYERRF